MAHFIDGEQVTKEEYNSRLPEIKDHAAKVNDYVAKVQAGEITIEEVPEEYRAEVDAIINAPKPEEPEPTYTLDEAAAIIASEVASNE